MDARGLRLQGKPVQRGVYINNGKKLLAGSITEVNSTGLGTEDVTGISEDPNSNWGR
ncbi:MAG: hypothetical protein IJ552_02965 [Prevotella sp.]|nr:hypothetical protein [Prevotella sp.]